MIWVLRTLAVLVAIALVHFVYADHKNYEPKDADRRINTLTFAFAVVMFLLNFRVGC